MPTIGANVLTLSDWAKRVDPDGKVPMIAELLSQSNEVLQDMLWMESNGATSHRTTVRTGLPTSSWRLINNGIQPTKSRTAQIDESIGILEAWSEVDVDLAMLNGNTSAFRLSEAQAFIESMNQEKVQTLFFGNSSVDPEEFTGFSPRYASISAGDIAQNVLDGGGTGSDNTSIWLVVWGANSVFGVFPKGSTVGLTHQDLGEVTVETTAGIAGNRMRAFQDRWQWKCGLVVKDWRFAVRIANIDVSDLVANTTPADLTDLMIRAIHRVPNLRLGRASFYMNRTVMQMLDIQRRDDVVLGGGLTFQVVDGVQMRTFRGIPLRIVDQLIETEAQVT